MRQHKDLVVIDAGRGNSIDGSLERIKLSAAKSATHKKRDIAPSRTAAFLLKSRAIRLEQFRDIITDIDDIAWHILLDLTVAISSGKHITTHDLSITHNVPMSTMSRYVDYLRGAGMIDKNVFVRDEARAPLKLSVSGQALTNKTLRKIGSELSSF